MEKMKRRTVISTILIMLVAIALGLFIYRYQLYMLGDYNLSFAWTAAGFFILMWLVVAYMYNEYKYDCKGMPSDETKEKIRICAAIVLVLSMLMAYYIQSIAAVAQESRYSANLLNLIRLVVSLVTGGASFLTLLVTYMIMIKGMKIPVLGKMADIGEHIEGATARLIKNNVERKTAEKVLSNYLRYILGIVTTIILLAVVVYRNLSYKGSIIGYIVDGNWEKGLNVFAITSCLMILCVGSTVSFLIKEVLRVFSKTLGARGETVCKMFISLTKYAIFIVMVFYCLAELGVDTSTLVASAGILSLVVGLGAKELISDILAGLFIIIEGEFRVGDIVMVGDFRGRVTEIGVRTTKLEDMSNNVKIINNSQISGVVNMTKKYSYGCVDMCIDYGESLERVEAVLVKEFPQIKEKLSDIIEGPFYKGVVELGDSGVYIRIIVICKEQDRIQTERNLRRELKLVFDRNNISIPYPQIVVNEPREYKKATKKESAEAQRFKEEQEVLAKELEIETDSVSDDKEK